MLCFSVLLKPVLYRTFHMFGGCQAILEGRKTPGWECVTNLEEESVPFVTSQKGWFPEVCVCSTDFLKS